MLRFKAYNYDQNAMVVINYQDQLQPSTFEYAAIKGFRSKLNDWVSFSLTLLGVLFNLDLTLSLPAAYYSCTALER